MSTFRTAAVVAALLLLPAVLPLAACGKKGPLYLPDKATQAATSTTNRPPDNRADQDRR